MVTEAARKEAVADIVGGLCYALLRVYQITAAATAGAPSIDLAERQAAFAHDEFARHRRLRARLDELTAEPQAAMDRFRETVDAFYVAAQTDRWLESQTFHFVGNTITTDFAEIVASRFDDKTAAAVREALTGRTEQESFALGQILDAIEAEGAPARDRVAHYTASLVGAGLNRFREALLGSNSLEVVLGGPEAVKDVVLELLGRHRERLVRLGIEQLED